MGYVLGLSGCSPHAASGGAVDGIGRTLAASATPPLVPCADGWVDVPTGLDNLQPAARLSGGGASSFAGRDMRSGNPGETNTVQLKRAVLAARGRTLRAVRLNYRYVVGYSAAEGDPAPHFTIEMSDGDTDGASCTAGSCDCWRATEPLPVADEPPASDDTSCTPCVQTHQLYKSPDFSARPYSWDAATGGSPTNYSPPVKVTIECDIRLQGARQTLSLIFHNGRRNIHLQGGSWPDGGGCELDLRLQLV